jgi:homoserine dehydrogenase
MTDDGVEFEDALREAQAKGFAEADPTLDVDGHDAAQKLKILTELAFSAQVDADAVQVEGIRDIAADDVQAARELGFVIKHVATAELSDDSLSLGCAPVLLPLSHQLAGIRDENNAVLVRGDAVGEMLFSGKGAGSLPSASAVLSDVVDIACHKGGFSFSPGGQVKAANRDCDSRHYLRFTVGNPSAIGPVTTILERNRVGVARAAAVWARNDSGKHQVRVLTHACSRRAVEAARSDIAGSGLEKGKGIVLRVAD